MIKLYLIRHGETSLNQCGKMQGWCDAPLLDHSIKKAKQTGLFINEAGIKFDAIYHSDSGRVIQTVENVVKGYGEMEAIVYPDSRLREMYFGEAEGKTSLKVWSTVAKENGFDSYESLMLEVEALDRIKYLSMLTQYKNAEKLESFKQRIKTVIEEIIQDAIDKGFENVLIVTHGLTIINILSLCVNPPVLFTSPKNLSLSKIDIIENKLFVDYYDRVLYM